MKRLPLAFFTAGVICVLTGMLWGAVMGATQNFTLSPAHAHLNLVGWASLAIMGTFYQLSGRAGRIGWANFILSTLGVVVMIPALTYLLSGHPEAEPFVGMGGVIAILGMVCFAGNVISSWKTAQA